MWEAKPISTASRETLTGSILSGTREKTISEFQGGTDPARFRGEPLHLIFVARGRYDWLRPVAKRGIRVMLPARGQRAFGTDSAFTKDPARVADPSDRSTLRRIGFNLDVSLPPFFPPDDAGHTPKLEFWVRGIPFSGPVVDGY
jgi:hypothetical protein